MMFLMADIDELATALTLMVDGLAFRQEHYSASENS